MRILTVLVLFISFSACMYRQKIDTESIMRVSALTIDTGVYRVRVSIPRKIWENLERKTIENLMYRTDSCIYHKGRSGKVLPLYVETIANPNKYTIEYLVEFDKELLGSLNVFYDDRYINFETYPLNLK